MLQLIVLHNIRVKEHFNSQQNKAFFNEPNFFIKFLLAVPRSLSVWWQATWLLLLLFCLCICWDITAYLQFLPSSFLKVLPSEYTKKICNHVLAQKIHTGTSHGSPWQSSLSSWLLAMCFFQRRSLFPSVFYFILLSLYLIFNKHLTRIYHIPNIVLATGVIKVNIIKTSPSKNLVNFLVLVYVYSKQITTAL